MGAPEGNQNAAKGRRWLDALNKALARYVDPARQVAAGQALDKIAQNVVAAAVKGDRDAIVEIANRLDGKPAQGITLGSDEENPVKVSHKVEFVGSRSTPEET